jgi:phytoene synthase
MPTEVYDYCSQLIKKEMPDFYLLAMLMPENKQHYLLAVFAFNHEISKTRETVTETAIGLMRLLWWREAIQDIYQGNTTKEHPILQALTLTIKENNLPLQLFEDLTYAREFDLEDVQPSNMQGLLNYCDFTHTPLFKLCLKILDEDVDCQETAIQYGLIKTMKNTVYFARQNRSYLPQNLCTKEDILKPANREKLVDSIKQISIGFKRTSVNNSKFLKAITSLTIVYQKQLKAVHYDVLQYRFSLPPLAKGLRVWIATIL